MTSIVNVVSIFSPNNDDYIHIWYHCDSRLQWSRNLNLELNSVHSFDPSFLQQIQIQKVWVDEMLKRIWPQNYPHSGVYSIIMNGSASEYFNTPLYCTNTSHHISKLMELMECHFTTRDQTEIIKSIQCRREQISGLCWLPDKKWTLSRILVLVYSWCIHHIHSLLWALSGLKFISNALPTPLLSFFYK